MIKGTMAGSMVPQRVPITRPSPYMGICCETFGTRLGMNMKKPWFLLFVVLLCDALWAQALVNGGFEEASDGKVKGWHAYGSYACETGTVHSGARAIRCASTDGKKRCCRRDAGNRLRETGQVAGAVRRVEPGGTGDRNWIIASISTSGMKVAAMRGA